jgi:hypothetical protein
LENKEVHGMAFDDLIEHRVILRSVTGEGNDQTLVGELRELGNDFVVIWDSEDPSEVWVPKAQIRFIRHRADKCTRCG